METEQHPIPEKGKPAITISIQTWATPIVGLVMLIIGLFGGYYIRPILNAQSAQADVSIRSQ